MYVMVSVLQCSTTVTVDTTIYFTAKRLCVILYSACIVKVGIGMIGFATGMKIMTDVHKIKQILGRMLSERCCVKLHLKLISCGSGSSKFSGNFEHVFFFAE